MPFSNAERVHVQMAWWRCLRGGMMIEGFHHDNKTRSGFRSSGSLCCPIWCRTGWQSSTKEHPKQGDGGRGTLGGVGATLLTAGPRARTQCGGGTGAPTGHGKRLSLHPVVERPDWPNARGLCVRLIRGVMCVYGTKTEWPGVSNVWERFSGIKSRLTSGLQCTFVFDSHFDSTSQHKDQI